MDCVYKFKHHLYMALSNYRQYLDVDLGYGNTLADANSSMEIYKHVYSNM